MYDACVMYEIARFLVPFPLMPQTLSLPHVDVALR